MARRSRALLARFGIGAFVQDHDAALAHGWNRAQVGLNLPKDSTLVPGRSGHEMLQRLPVAALIQAPCNVLEVALVVQGQHGAQVKISVGTGVPCAAGKHVPIPFPKTVQPQAQVQNRRQA